MILLEVLVRRGAGDKRFVSDLGFYGKFVSRVVSRLLYLIGDVGLVMCFAIGGGGEMAFLTSMSSGRGCLVDWPYLKSMLLGIYCCCFAFQGLRVTLE